MSLFRDTSENMEKKNEDLDREAEIKSPRALHLTVSLFVRNVPPKISHSDLDTVSRLLKKQILE